MEKNKITENTEATVAMIALPMLLLQTAFPRINGTLVLGGFRGRCSGYVKF
jgi:hypothetical protein